MPQGKPSKKKGSQEKGKGQVEDAQKRKLSSFCEWIQEAVQQSSLLLSGFGLDTVHTTVA